MTCRATGSIAVLPLDARPCTLSFPVQIARIAGIEVVAPPLELLGDLNRPAAADEIQAWLRQVAPQVDAMVLSLDTLVFGGLIPARRGHEPLELLLDRLEFASRLGVPLLAFGITMRIPDSSVADEEPAYWADYGPQIHAWSRHADRHSVLGQAEDWHAAQQARRFIPDSVAEDFLTRRRRNFAVHEREFELARQGCFEVLCLTQDDTAPFGFNQAEKRALLAQAPHQALIYPGADEVAACLVGRWINLRSGRWPQFKLRVFPPESAGIVAMYEDVPLVRTAASQLAAAGVKLALEDQHADLEVLINAPATGQGDLALQINLDRVDQPSRDLTALRERLRSGPPAALADLAYANGADPRLWSMLEDWISPQDLAAFAAWNTAGNTLGTVAALASAYLSPGFNQQAHQDFIFNRLADDYLYQAILRGQLQREGQAITKVEQELGDRLTRLWREHFPQLAIKAIRASLPWRRLFEAAVDVES